MDVDRFARALLSGQPTVPRYFARMRPLNQAGPRLLGGFVPLPRPLEVADARAAIERGALVLDLRTGTEHASGHLPGSLSIPAGSSFGTWLGWVVPEPDRPIVLIVRTEADWDDAVRQALRIGFEGILGYVRGGFLAWAEAGLPTEVGGTLDVAALATRLDRDGSDAPLLIDVRQPSEYEAGHVPGAVSIGAGDLPDRLDTLPRDRPIATICASGYRSTVAASLLRAAGFEDVSWVTGGVPTWAARGLPVAYGSDDPAADWPGGAGSPSTTQPVEAHSH
jgi:hydroxyacylglutathione hydrolase